MCRHLSSPAAHHPGRHAIGRHDCNRFHRRCSVPVFHFCSWAAAVTQLQTRVRSAIGRVCVTACLVGTVGPYFMCLCTYPFYPRSAQYFPPVCCCCCCCYCCLFCFILFCVCVCVCVRACVFPARAWAAATAAAVEVSRSGVYTNTLLPENGLSV